MTKHKYIWEIKYKNGNKYNSDELKYGDIERKKVLSISILKDNEVVYSIPIENNDKFFYRRRVAITYENSKQICHIVGRITPVGKKIAFIFEDGNIHIKDNFKEGHRWFYSPKLCNGEI